MLPEPAGGPAWRAWRAHATQPEPLQPAPVGDDALEHARERLSAETIALLRAHGPAGRQHVITDVLPLEDGPALLADLAARRRHVIQAVLTCA